MEPRWNFGNPATVGVPTSSAAVPSVVPPYLIDNTREFQEFRTQAGRSAGD
jgi:hypothetical protein